MAFIEEEYISFDMEQKVKVVEHSFEIEFKPNLLPFQKEHTDKKPYQCSRCKRALLRDPIIKNMRDHILTRSHTDAVNALRALHKVSLL